MWKILCGVVRWCFRWAVAGAAVVVLVVLGMEMPRADARAALEKLPLMDVAARAAELRGEGRFGEAMVVVEAGLDWMKNESGPAREALVAERARIEEAQTGLWARVKRMGAGALTGEADSMEALAGAVVADFFVIGDIRDLVLEGVKSVQTGEEPDPVIVALSTAGLVTTLAPEIDWAPSVMKAGRRMGAMTRRMGAIVVDAVKTRKAVVLTEVFEDVGTLSRKGGPRFAAEVLRFVDDPAALRRRAAFVEKRAVEGPFALHVLGAEAEVLLPTAVRVGDPLEGVARAALEQPRAAEELAVMLSRRGEAGKEFLRSGEGKRLVALIRPHPLLGAMKFVAKDRAGEAAGLIGGWLDEWLRSLWKWIALLALGALVVAGGLVWWAWRGTFARLGAEGVTGRVGGGGVGRR